MTSHYFEMTLYFMGLITVLAIFLPFSPMTIDIINISRDAQITIYRRRHLLWSFAVLCFGIVLLYGLNGLLDNSSAFGSAKWFSESLVSPDTLWLRVTLITIPVLVLLFWSGYVPFVMSPPNRHRLLALADADKIVGANDMVLGLVLGNEVRAYLRDEIARPHYFLDTVGGVPLTISYCILCNSGFAFISELDGKPLNMRCVTAYDNNIIYYDQASGNFIQQLEARVISGPGKGKSLNTLPVMLSSWGDWKLLHPDTKLYSAPPTTIRDKMVGLMLQMMIPISKLSRRSKPWHGIHGSLDPRLPAMSLVLGVEINSDSCAYPVAALRDDPVLEDTVGANPIVVFYDGKLDVGGVYSRQIDAMNLTFHRAAKPGTSVVARDQQTGTLWTVSGAAHEGPFAGKSLKPVPHFNKLFWFSWALFKPATRIMASENPDAVH